MLDHLTTRGAKESIPITPFAPKALKPWLKSQPPAMQRWVETTGFEAKPGTHCLVPGDGGGLACVLLGLDGTDDLWPYGALPVALPPGRYRIDAQLTPEAAARASLGWALGGYVFDRYKKSKRRLATLVWPKQADRAAVARAAEAVFLIRDLVNTPAEDMGPPHLAQAARDIARKHGAKVTVIAGDALLKRNYPTIHTVGRASTRAPRLIDLRWGAKGPKVTIVGKGVCFDSGGLDLKPAGAMKLMKKDMGGAAHALALAQMVMAAGLPLRLRLMVPAVDNSVAGNAFRPLDVIKTRKGLTVEVGNTDAEGRLVLCDALAEADRERPDLIIDFATLTGAARVALGPELPAVFGNHDPTVDALLRYADEERDPLWRLPLHSPYRSMLDSKVADINNVSEGGFAGAITAALFLKEFVSETTPWVHLDLMAWNPGARPGRPAGGEAMGLRAAFALVRGLLGSGSRPRKASK